MESTDFTTEGLDYVDLNGLTQLRVYFANHDNGDNTNDYLGFYSGDYTDKTKRPKMILTYTTTKPIIIFAGTAAEDGRVYDNDEDGNGNSADATDDDGDALRLGDYYLTPNNVSYKTILSFNTFDIPDDVTIISAKLRMTRSDVAEGTDPFIWGGTCNVDIANPSFGATALAAADFENPASATAVASFAGPDPGENQQMLSTEFNAQGIGYINKSGTTQLRVYFTIPHLAGGNDYLGFYSEENATEQYRPRLIIQYTVN